MKIKKFCALKDTIHRVRRQPTEWEKRFASHVYFHAVFNNTTFVSSATHMDGHIGEAMEGLTETEVEEEEEVEANFTEALGETEVEAEP